MKPKHSKAPAERVVKDIRRAARMQYSAEEKIRIVLEGLRGDASMKVGAPRARSAVLFRENMGPR